MTGASTQDWDHGDVAAAARIRTLVMAIDGSDRAARALDQLAGLGRAIGAEVEAVHIAGDDPTAAADGLVTRLGFGADLIGCIATHGRDRLAPVLGSVASDVLAQLHAPLLLCGPESVWPPAAGAPVVAGVDGSAEDTAVVAAAAGWARRLGTTLHLVTVAEPVPDPVGDHVPHRNHGPAAPEEHVAALSALARHEGVETETSVRYDPVGVADPFVDECRHLGAALVVVGSRRHTGLRRIVFGTHATRIVHGSPALVLAVPLTP